MHASSQIPAQSPKKNQRAVNLVIVTVKTEWLNVELPFVFKGGTDQEVRTQELSKKLDVMTTRARSLGGEMEWQIDSSKPVPVVEALASSVVGSINERLRHALSSRHATEMKREYLHRRRMGAVLLDAALSRQYGGSREDLNNIGYIYMANGDYRMAEEALRLAVEKQDVTQVKGLAEFNLGVAEVMLGHMQVANTWLTKALQTWDEDPPKESSLACLLVPTRAQGKLTLQERLHPNPLETVKEALAAASIQQA